MNLKQFRKENKLTLKELASELNIHPVYLSLIENKKKTPSVKLAKKIIKVTQEKVTWEDLYSE